MRYAISNILYILLYYVVRYRHKVVHSNLATSFPDMSAAELRSTERRFYRNFADTIVETLALPLISDKVMARRMEFVGLEHIDSILDSGRSVAVYFAHTFNWEWATSVTLHSRHKPSETVEYGQVYRPLKSAWADKLMLRLRARFHSVCYPKASALRCLLKARKRGALTVTGFMSDQHPSHGDPGHFTYFLNHPTLMITGTETLARKLDMGAVYWDMHHLGRGRYRIVVHPLSQRVADTPQGQVTEQYTRLLEQTLQRDPAIWLWSHNRWKHPVSCPK